MRREDETVLSRALFGDLEARRALARREAESPGLAAEIEPLERVWAELELPAPAPVPAGFAARTAALAAEERSLLPGFTLSPVWSGAAAALVVAIGIAGGTGLGAYALPDGGMAVASADEAAGFWADDGLLDGQLFAADAAEPAPGDFAGANEGAP